MKSTYLRIGNLIFINGEQEAVSSLQKYTIDNVRFNCDQSDWTMEGIPLTEEWLVKFGFGLHKYPSPSRGKTLYFKVDNETFWIEVYFPRNVKIDVVVSLNDKYLRHIKYVHQLQNLYFALTGKELAP